MKRLLLITLLVVSSGPAYAEWVSFYELPQGEKTKYVDRDTIRRKGDLVKVWFLFDHKTVQTEAGKSYLSGKVQYEIDCAEDRMQVLAGSFSRAIWDAGMWLISSMTNSSGNQFNQGAWSRSVDICVQQEMIAQSTLPISSHTQS